MLGYMVRANFQGLVLACMALLVATSAQAAPQVLALIATGQPVALTCDADQCSVELPTLCLQPERRMPLAGQAYRLAEGQSVTLVGQLSAGETISIPVAHKIDFAALRSHVAVNVMIPRHTVSLRGFVDPAIRVDGGVSLVPIVEVGDDRPQAPDEVRRAIVSGRALATDLVDRDSDRMPAVRLVNELINRLPETGPTDRNVVARLSRKFLQASDVQNISPSAVERARFNFDLCTSHLRDGVSHSLRGCLETLNDGAMQYLSNELEPVLKTGS